MSLFNFPTILLSEMDSYEIIINKTDNQFKFITEEIIP
jgi:hypothetical protein